MTILRISRLVAVLAILLVIGASVMYRNEQIPRSVKISAKLQLWRDIEHSWGSFVDVTFLLVREVGTFDNVTLSQAWRSDVTSTAHWKLVIVANESSSQVVKWEHEIVPSSDQVGIFEGTVSSSLPLKGTFTVWVELFAVRNASVVFISSFSERIHVY